MVTVHNVTVLNMLLKIPFRKKPFVEDVTR